MSIDFFIGVIIGACVGVGCVAAYRLLTGDVTDEALIANKAEKLRREERAKERDPADWWKDADGR